ncbi:MAG: uridine kinase, partial [Proteobacteria bacterium]|nr:uridine kinase [Pseudomonadota bacterium]
MKNELLSELGAALVNGSLTDKSLLAWTDRPATRRILPNANVVKIGGQSLIDRGRKAVFPLI